MKLKITISLLGLLLSNMDVHASSITNIHINDDNNKKRTREQITTNNSENYNKRTREQITTNNDASSIQHIETGLPKLTEIANVGLRTFTQEQKNEQIESIKNYLSSQGNPNYNQRNVPLFHYAVKLNDSNLVQMFLENETFDKKSINAGDYPYKALETDFHHWGGDYPYENLETPLVMAIENRNVEIVQLLLDANVDLNNTYFMTYPPRSDWEYSAYQIRGNILHYICAHKITDINDIIPILVDKGADLYAKAEIRRHYGPFPFSGYGYWHTDPRTPYDFAKDDTLKNFLRVIDPKLGEYIRRRDHPSLLERIHDFIIPKTAS
jgi:hypothetical protein